MQISGTLLLQLGVLLATLAVLGAAARRFALSPIPVYLLAGLALYVLAGAAITQVEHLAGLIGWRFLQGLAGCAGAVLTFAIIRDRCDMRQSAQNISLLILILGAAPVIAPLLDGCLR